MNTRERGWNNEVSHSTVLYQTHWQRRIHEWPNVNETIVVCWQASLWAAAVNKSHSSTQISKRRRWHAKEEWWAWQQPTVCHRLGRAQFWSSTGAGLYKGVKMSGSQTPAANRYKCQLIRWAPADSQTDYIYPSGGDYSRESIAALSVCHLNGSVAFAGCLPALLPESDTVDSARRHLTPTDPSNNILSHSPWESSSHHPVLEHAWTQSTSIHKDI